MNQASPAYDTAHVRGLFPDLSDGWIRLNLQQGSLVPDTVSRHVAKTFRWFPRLNQQSVHLVDNARQAIADLIGGTTAGVILAPDRAILTQALIHGFSPHLTPEKNLLLTRLNDQINFLPWQRAAKELGSPYQIAEFDLETGEIPTSQFDNIIEKNNISLAVLSATSAVMGTIIDVGWATRKIHDQGGLVIVDCTNAAAHFPLDIEELHADVVMISASSWGGPAVAAAVFRKPELINTLQTYNNDSTRGSARIEYWSHQPHILAGLTASIDHIAELWEGASGSRRSKIVQSMTILQDHHSKLLSYTLGNLETFASLKILGSPRYRSPLLSFFAKEVTSGQIVKRLEKQRISAISNLPSPALRQLGVEDFPGAVTIGLAQYTTPYEIDHFVRSLGSII